jgi:hypothetical protein
VVVHKTKNDLHVTCTQSVSIATVPVDGARCTRDGYEDADTVVPAKFNSTTAGNIIAGGLVGIAVDAASGANYDYPTSTVVTMKPVGASAAPTASSSASPTS